VTCRGISRDRCGLDLDELAILGAVIVFIANIRDSRR